MPPIPGKCVLELILFEYFTEIAVIGFKNYWEPWNDVIFICQITYLKYWDPITLDHQYGKSSGGTPVSIKDYSSFLSTWNSFIVGNIFKWSKDLQGPIDYFSFCIQNFSVEFTAVHQILQSINQTCVTYLS